MITFRYADQRIQLGAGETWSAPSAGDTYRDTSASELQAIVREVENGIPWREAVGRHFAETNPWLYQAVTSPKRDLFFRLYPPFAGAKVIDIGAGWGQTSLPLAQRCEVTALEPTPERLAFIRAAARQSNVASRMNFIGTDFFDVEFESDFDLAFCIGVLEWVPKFREGDPRELQIEFLKRIHSSLRPGGQLVLGIENRMGLKYLLGAADDHIGTPGIAMYDALLAARKWRNLSGQELRSFTYTQPELKELLKAADFHSVAFYAAVPDYKLPEIITPLGPLTEAHFASKPHISEYHGNDGRPFGEEQQEELHSHYRSLARMGIAGNFAPSYFVVAVNDQTVRPSSGEVLHALRQAQKIERADDVELDLYPSLVTRKDRGRKWAYKVARGDHVLFHLTVARSGLTRLYERAKAFAQACPDIACKPLFFLEVEESSLQLFGQEYFAGETLDSAVARGACDARQWMAAANIAMAALEKSTCSSSLEAYDKEVKELREGVLSNAAFSRFDKQVLQDWIFPILFEAGRKVLIRARWTNGDFYGANILRNTHGEIRLIDYEFAFLTHFFHTDTFRLREFSVLPSDLGSLPLVHSTENSQVDELHFCLQYLQMLQEVIRPEVFLSHVPTIVERILTLVSQVSPEHSQMVAVSSTAIERVKSTAVERDAVRKERDAFREERDALRKERDALRKERDAFREERDAFCRRIVVSGESIVKLETDLEQLNIARNEAKRECQSMRASLSWRLTWPLRILRDAIEKIPDKAKNRLPR
jgi:2-polyprenyl-3-methyl-5-hydroxy-6-metoxy-1,4-benzoquinol methylase